MLKINLDQDSEKVDFTEKFLSILVQSLQIDTLAYADIYIIISTCIDYLEHWFFGIICLLHIVKGVTSTITFLPI